MSKKPKEESKTNTPLGVDWEHNFPNGEISPIASGTPILMIAIDTEYQSNYTCNKNLLLSYQYSAYDLMTGKYKSGIFYPDIKSEERYTFSQLFRKVLKDMGIAISSLKDYKVIFVAHFFTAEWSMFKDRDELYMKFEYIRKTMTTTRNSLKTTIKDENDELINMNVDFKDTMLLLPEGFKSLEKASTFIEGYEKIDLDVAIKQNMIQFMIDKPQLFKEYAIRDAEVTLKLFVKLQYLLNKINKTESEIFSTLASATTKHFTSYSRNKFEGLIVKKEPLAQEIHSMQYDRKHHLYQKFVSLADRSYMGGLNSSYYIGECEGYTFIDIDFKNCYPTALNLLKIGDFGQKVRKSARPKYEEIDLSGLDDD